MPYDFDFDLTKISRSFFRELAKFSENRKIHSRIGNIVEKAVKRFNIQKMTGVPVADSVELINDMIDIHAKNLSQKEEFEKTDNRALLLPHCARKFMDKRCKATFDPELSAYSCEMCSEDCLINQATQKGEKRGYDVHVLPGGSCISKILKEKDYDGIIGVACSDEINLGKRYMNKVGIPYQGVPLLKNGCSDTIFNLNTLEDIL